MQHYRSFFAAIVIMLVIGACKSPEERATGEDGGSRDDSMKNSQPMVDPNATPNKADSTQMRDNSDTARLTDTTM